MNDKQLLLTAAALSAVLGGLAGAGLSVALAGEPVAERAAVAPQLASAPSDSGLGDLAGELRLLRQDLVAWMELQRATPVVSERRAAGTDEAVAPRALDSSAEMAEAIRELARVLSRGVSSSVGASLAEPVKAEGFAREQALQELRQLQPGATSIGSEARVSAGRQLRDRYFGWTKQDLLAELGVPDVVRSGWLYRQEVATGFQEEYMFLFNDGMVTHVSFSFGEIDE